MRICMAVRATPAHRPGGLEWHAHDLANALCARGHEVTVVTSAAPATHDVFSDGESAPRRYQRVHLSAGRPGDYSWSFFRTLGDTIRALDATRRFDVIHGQEFAGMFLPDFGGRLVATVHGTLFTETELDRRYRAHVSFAGRLRNLWKFKHRLALAPFFAPALRRCAAVAVDSAFTAGELAHAVPGLRPAPSVIPLGIDWTRYAEPWRAGEDRLAGPRALTVLCLGRVQRRKGVFAAVEAVAGLVYALSCENVKLAVCGGGEDLEELRGMVAARGLDDWIRCPGRASRDDMARLMAGADVLLFPDLTQPAFGLVVLEAMHHGVPVVGARNGAIPEVVDDAAGWIYDPWDGSGLIGLLHRLAKKSDEVAAKAAAAPGVAARFNVGRMAEDYETMYAEVGRRGVR